MFNVDQSLIDNARQKLAKHTAIYWIIGGSCTGKSTISKAIAEAYHIPLYDMDEHIYGRYMGQYTEKRHPVNKAWLSASNPLDWQLSLSPEAFDAYNRATNAEYLDLFADDIQANYPQQPLLVDGGITHPSLLCQVIPPENIFCIDADIAECNQIWETSEARAEMKQWIFGLPDPKLKWETFLQFNELISRTIVEACHTHHIQVYMRDEHTTVDFLKKHVADFFKIAPSDSN